MVSRHPPVEVKVWGPYACFTRPEAKVERVTYPVMTPSSARGVLEAIFWKPEFHWRINEIVVLNPVHYVGMLRNEVKSKISEGTVKKWISKGCHESYFADADRTQRHTLALRNVAYVIRATIELMPHAMNDDPAKYRDQFRRRVSKGQCFHRPYLGCREFAADFGEPDTDSPVELSDKLGHVLFDMRYTSDGSGRGAPIFFDAQIEDGVLRVPQHLYEQLEGGEQ